MQRRSFIQSAGALGGLALIGWPRLAFANLATDRRLILVILRGALDGLAAVVPHGDRDYATARGGLAFAPPGDDEGVIDLDGFYGLNPALAPLHALYNRREMAIIHAVATPYRDRSHFDAQNLLENGTTMPGGTVGWLNRALQILKADGNSAIALNQQVPLILQGMLETATWSPKGRDIDPNGDYLAKVARLYQQDPLLGAAFAQAMQTEAMAGQSLSADDRMAASKAKGTDQLFAAAKAAATFLAADTGPRIAVLEASGWDTHARQGTVNGQLFNRLAELAHALAVFPTSLGETWKKTVVLVVTEFGRTVAENGTGGTDHGTGGVALVLGGAIEGGRVLGQWPGLAPAKLYQNRDLMPTSDLRSLFKTVLVDQLKVPTAPLEAQIFPNSASASLIKGLII